MTNKTIYSVYVRAHSKDGTFEGVISDLERIQSLGTDILWLLPIHPIGQKNKKGGLGCPYSISDYRTINPEYGTLEDFKKLIAETHQHGMKLMMDVVYNHTAHDHVFTNTHPEFYYRKANGKFGNKVGDWSDIIDLDFNNIELQKELIATLVYWASLGVDGFRCDVAPLVPLTFWQQAKQAVAEINPETIWFSESVEPDFLVFLRQFGATALSDSEIFQVFDLSYDYDVYPYFKKWLRGETDFPTYLSSVARQQYLYPVGKQKVRFLDNHDQQRIRALLAETQQQDLLIPLTIWTYLQAGVTLIYSGDECQVLETPDLFNKTTIDWDAYDETYAQLLKKLDAIKKLDILDNMHYLVHETYADHTIACASYVATDNDQQLVTQRLYILVNMSTTEQTITLLDAHNTNPSLDYITQEPTEISDNTIKLSSLEAKVFVVTT